LTVKRAGYDAATQLYWFVGLRSDVLAALRDEPLTRPFDGESFSIDQGHVRADGVAVVGSRDANIG
jgi:hypothetical protein